MQIQCFPFEKGGADWAVDYSIARQSNYAVSITTKHASSKWMLVAAYSGWSMYQASARYNGKAFTQLWYNSSGSNGNGVNQRMSILVYNGEIPIGGVVTTSAFSGNGDNNSIVKVVLLYQTS